MRGDNQVIAVNDKVAHRGMRQIKLQRLPGIAGVKRYVNGIFRAGEKQTLSQRIFPHDVRGSIRGKARDDLLPSSAKIARSIDVRAEIIEAEGVDCRVGASWIEVRRLNDRNLSPGSQGGTRALLPAVFASARDVNQAIVRAGP